MKRRISSQFWVTTTDSSLSVARPGSQGRIAGGRRRSLRYPADSSAGIYTDANPAYPPLIPLLQVWTLGPSHVWNDAILGLTWLGLFCALGLGFAWQLYRMLP